MFREVTPVGQSNLKTDRTDYRERCSTKGFLEILSNVLVAQERRLSFTYGGLNESCSSFTLMYFGKRRASRINLFWKR